MGPVASNALARALRPHTQWPLTIVCDDGAEFYGDFARAMQKHGVRMDRNAPYNEDARGAVERVHRINLSVLAKLRSEFPRASFRELVTEAVWAVNTRPYTDTGVSAYEAHEGVSPFSAAERAALSEAHVVAAVRAATLQHQQQHVALATAERVRASIEKVQQKREDDNAYRLRLQQARRPPPRVFKTGDLVLYNGARTGAKLTQRVARVGPFVVADVRDGGHTATLKHGDVVKEPKVALRNCIPFADPLQLRMVREEGPLASQLALRGAPFPKWLAQREYWLMPRQA